MLWRITHLYLGISVSIPCIFNQVFLPVLFIQMSKNINGPTGRLH